MRSFSSNFPGLCVSRTHCLPTFKPPEGRKRTGVCVVTGQVGDRRMHSASYNYQAEMPRLNHSSSTGKKLSDGKKRKEWIEYWSGGRRRVGKVVTGADGSCLPLSCLPQGQKRTEPHSRRADLHPAPQPVKLPMTGYSSQRRTKGL